MGGTDKGLLFIILGATCFWLVFDEFFGNKRISNLSNLMTPSFPTLGEKIGENVDTILNGDMPAKEKEKQKILNSIDRGEIVIPVPSKDKNKAVSIKPKTKKAKRHLREAVEHIYGVSPS